MLLPSCRYFSCFLVAGLNPVRASEASFQFLSKTRLKSDAVRADIFVVHCPLHHSIKYLRAFPFWFVPLGRSFIKSRMICGGKKIIFWIYLPYFVTNVAHWPKSMLIIKLNNRWKLLSVLLWKRKSYVIHLDMKMQQQQTSSKGNVPNSNDQF